MILGGEAVSYERGTPARKGHGTPITGYGTVADPGAPSTLILSTPWALAKLTDPAKVYRSPAGCEPQ